MRFDPSAPHISPPNGKHRSYINRDNSTALRQATRYICMHIHLNLETSTTQCNQRMFQINLHRIAQGYPALSFSCHYQPVIPTLSFTPSVNACQGTYCLYGPHILPTKCYDVDGVCKCQTGYEFTSDGKSCVCLSVCMSICYLRTFQ